MWLFKLSKLEVRRYHFIPFWSTWLTFDHRSNPLSNDFQGNINPDPEFKRSELSNNYRRSSSLPSRRETDTIVRQSDITVDVPLSVDIHRVKFELRERKKNVWLTVVWPSKITSSRSVEDCKWKEVLVSFKPSMVQVLSILAIGVLLSTLISNMFDDQTLGSRSSTLCWTPISYYQYRSGVTSVGSTNYNHAKVGRASFLRRRRIRKPLDVN